MDFLTFTESKDLIDIKINLKKLKKLFIWYNFQ